MRASHAQQEMLMRQGSPQKQERRNVTLPDSAITRLEELKQRTGAASDSEVIRQALRVYQAITQDDGAEVIIREKATGRENRLVVP